MKRRNELNHPNLLFTVSRMTSEPRRVFVPWNPTLKTATPSQRSSSVIAGHSQENTLLSVRVKNVDTSVRPSHRLKLHLIFP
jgi:hypothetical protein